MIHPTPFRTRSGYGFGVGLRLDTPVAPLRLEYAWNDKRVGRFHVGVGYE